MLLKSVKSLLAIRDLRPVVVPEVGICRGEKPGDIGVWVVWDEGRASELFRISVKAFSRQRIPSLPPFSYTFAPAIPHSCMVSLETPLELRSFLRGRDRAREGHVVFEVQLDKGMATRTVELSDVVRCYLGKGPEPRHLAVPISGSIPIDSREVAVLPASQLKEHSEAAKRRIEEKRRKEEEDRKRLEEERIKAEKAAEAQREQAAAKAAADAAAKKSGQPSAAGEKAESALQGCRVAVIYGTTTGNTGNVAEMIKNELGSSADQLKSVTNLTASDFTIPEVLILGVPTWHIGEMQDDWAVILPELAKQDFKNKKIAIFGLGDGKGYPDTYVDAMQELWEKFEVKGAQLFGLWPTEGYEFQKSKALKDGKFLGLVIDVENQHHLSDERVKRWVTQIRKELSL